MPKAKTQTKKPKQVQTKRSAAARRPKRAPAKKSAKTKRSSKKRRAAVVQPSPLPTPLPVVAPISMSASALPSSLPTAAGTIPAGTTPESAGYKELPQQHDRWQLWLAVLAAATIIFIAWLYLTQRDLANIPSSVSNSIENAQVDTLIGDIKTDYSTLQDNMKALSDVASQASGTANTNTTPTTTTNSNDELNNLFSDLQ